MEGYRQDMTVDRAHNDTNKWPVGMVITMSINQYTGDVANYPDLSPVLMNDARPISFVYNICKLVTVVTVLS